MEKELSFEERVKKLRKKMRPAWWRQEWKINEFINKVIKEFESQAGGIPDGDTRDFYPSLCFLSDDDFRETGVMLEELGFTVTYLGDRSLLKMRVALTRKKRAKS